MGDPFNAEWEMHNGWQGLAFFPNIEINVELLHIKTSKQRIMDWKINVHFIYISFISWQLCTYDIQGIFVLNMKRSLQKQ